MNNFNIILKNNNKKHNIYKLYGYTGYYGSSQIQCFICLLKLLY